MTSIDEHKKKIKEHLEEIEDAINEGIEKKPQEEQKIEPLIERRSLVMFEKKEEIYSLIYNIEEERNSLVYGKPTENQVKKVLDNFLKLKEIFKELLKNEGIEI